MRVRVRTFMVKQQMSPIAACTHKNHNQQQRQQLERWHNIRLDGAAQVRSLTEQKDAAAESTWGKILLDGVCASSRACAEHQHASLLWLPWLRLSRSISAAALLRWHVVLALLRLLRRIVLLLIHWRAVSCRRVLRLRLRLLRLLRQLAVRRSVRHWREV